MQRRKIQDFHWSKVVERRYARDLGSREPSKPRGSDQGSGEGRRRGVWRGRRWVETRQKKKRMKQQKKKQGEGESAQSTGTETIRGAGWQQQMPRCGQDGELAPGTPVAGPAWDITRQMRSRADQRNASHWERLNGCWCAPANHHAVATNNKWRVREGERKAGKACWVERNRKNEKDRKRERWVCEAQAAGRGPNSHLIHSHLHEYCSPLHLFLTRLYSRRNQVNSIQLPSEENEWKENLNAIPRSEFRW